MMGLVWKDILVQRKTLRFYLLFTVFYAVMAVLKIFPYSVLTSGVVLCAIIVPINAFAYDNAARFDPFAAVLPGGRRIMVQSKYVLSLLLCGAAVVCVALFTLLLKLLGLMEESFAEMLLSLFACGEAGLLISAYMIPLVFKFGVEKARMFIMVAIALTVLAVVGLLGLIAEAEQFASALFAHPIMLAGVIQIVLIALLLLSYRISIHICMAKEF